MFDLKSFILVQGLVVSLLANLAWAASYPPNIDYGSQGDFIAKRGTELGRTTNLTMVGPILVNLPEKPGSSSVEVPYRGRDTVWDLSDLTNPTRIRDFSCWGCSLGQPISAHATVIRFDNDNSYLYTRNNNPAEDGDYMTFNPLGGDSNSQAVSQRLNWGFAPMDYTMMFSPYYVRRWWYGDDPSGLMSIRDPSRLASAGTDRWKGEYLVSWDHLGSTGVTGFSAWLGNLLVTASVQGSNGMAIYDVAGFKNGQVPRLLSTFQPTLTEPDGNQIGLGGYWVEPYGANKMVWASTKTSGIPKHNYPAMFIVDFTDPTDPQLTCELYFNRDGFDPSDGDDSSNPMYVNFQDNFAFVDHFKVDIDACETAYADGQISDSEFDQIVYRFDDIANSCEASQYFRPLGQVGIFGGYDWWETPSVNEQGMCFMVTSDAPDTNPPYVSGHRPLADQINYPVDGFIHLHIPETLRTETVVNAVSVTNLSNNLPIAFKQQLSHTGTLSVWPDQDLAPNTAYQVNVSGIQDFMGNTMTPYSFRFSTGAQLPSVPPPPSPPSNEAPVADANGPYSGQLGNSITFDGSGSTDDVTIVTYAWNFGDGNTGSGVSPTHTYASTGSYNVLLTVTDDGNPALVDSDTSTATITDFPAPPPSNEAPVADANGPYSGQLGNSITFDGSGSTDDVTIVTYAWNFGDGNTGSGVSPTHTYASTGSYTVTLTVTDDGNPALVDSDTSTATITDFPAPPPPNEAPVADANGPYSAQLGSSITFDGSGSTDDVTIVTYAWNFGDGNTGSGVSPTHTYASTGSYTVTLTVTDDGNPALVDSDTSTATISDFPPPPPPPPPPPGPDVIPSLPGVAYYPNQSSQLACEPEVENGNVWVVNPNNDSVTIIDRTLSSSTFELTTAVTREIKVNYEYPASVTKVGGQFAVTYRDDDKILFYDAEGTALRAIDSGHGTQPIASVADGSMLYVALYGSGEVIKINASTGEIQSRLTVGPKPKAMGLVGNRLLVTRYISSTDRGEVYDINVGGSMSLTRTITVNKILVPDDIDHGSGIPNYLSSIVISPDGEKAYITAVKANIDRGLFLNGQPLDDDNTVRAIIITLDLVNNRDANTDPSTRDGAIDMDNAADPSGITFLPDGVTRVHALQGNNILGYNNIEQNTSANVAAGFAPQSMCTTLRTLYVKNFTDRTVSAIDIAGWMHEGALNPDIQSVNTVTQEKLSAEELAGLKLFYHARMPDISPEGYISCASCHSNGGNDGMTWDVTHLGEGLRNTMSLNGASGTRFGDLHWSGNFDEVEDFEIQMENLNGGEGLIPGITFTTQSPLTLVTSGQSADLDALATYVNSLGKDRVKHSPNRTYAGALTKAAERGSIIFSNNGCADCHAGAAFRDGLRHDVGTTKASSGSRLGGAALTEIRTPSLIELWETGPFFHDGSASTLHDVFNQNSHPSHAVGLASADEADLIAYLLSIDRGLYIEDAAVFPDF